MGVDQSDNFSLGIKVNKLSKKFNQQRLFNDLSFSLIANDTLAIVGSNGSGKSTLLKIIAGVIPPTKGEVIIEEDDKRITSEKLHRQINICAPYLDLLDEFTLKEHLLFHEKFKALLKNVSLENVLIDAGLNNSYNKLVGEFSSGMKQRLKLILSLCYEGNIILLDEPSSHLDQKGKQWYQNLMTKYTANRITIIFSNEPEEYGPFTKKMINIEI